MGETVRLVLTVFQVVVCLALILSVLMQSGKAQGLGEIGGAAETFFGKNKARALDAKLEKITEYSAGIFLVLTFVLAVF
ncbi:MAG: preprotein translocase subunit SecG [Butyricicoccaceae bacterium]|nr:preprotein translocase subunit SecG [Clostridia bacterium]